MSSRQVVLIIGVGRSGTSALTRVLALCGCALPTSVVGPTDFNPRGSWEPVDIWTLNHKFMLQHETEYADPTLRLQETLINPNVREEYINDVRGRFADCNCEKPFLIKQPDITEVLDLWIEAACRDKVDMRIVIPIRHPSEVFASMAAAGWVTSRECANAFWLKRNLLAERYSRQCPRVFVEYSNLLKDWRCEVRRVAAALSLSLEPQETAIEDFLTSDLRRQRDAGPLVETFAYSWVTRVHAILLAAAEDGAVDIPAMDEIYYGYRTNERTFRIAWDEFRNRLRMLDPERLAEGLSAVPTMKAGDHF